CANTSWNPSADVRAPTGAARRGEGRTAKPGHLKGREAPHTARQQVTMPHVVCPNKDCACKTGGEIPPCHYCGHPSDSNWVRQDLTRRPADEEGPGRHWCLRCIGHLKAEFGIKDREMPPA